jgi:hypothetical protein
MKTIVKIQTGHLLRSAVKVIKNINYIIITMNNKMNNMTMSTIMQ